MVFFRHMAQMGTAENVAGSIADDDEGEFSLFTMKEYHRYIFKSSGKS